MVYLVIVSMGYQPLVIVLTHSGLSSDCFNGLSTSDNCSHLQLPHSNHCLRTINRQLWQTGGSTTVAAWECLGGGQVVTAGLSFAQCWEQLCSKWLRDPLQRAGCDNLWLCPTPTRQQSSWRHWAKTFTLRFCCCFCFLGGWMGGKQKKKSFLPKKLRKTSFGENSFQFSLKDLYLFLIKQIKIQQPQNGLQTYGPSPISLLHKTQ